MYPTTRELQIRLNALNIFEEHGLAPLVVDGINGKKTRQALQFAMRDRNLDHARELFHPDGITRIHWHWTGGTYEVTGFEKSHYHGVYDYLGGKHYTEHDPTDQADYSYSKGIGCSHTLNANKGALGLSIDCMGGATENGRVADCNGYPPTWEGIDAMLEDTAMYCKIFDIPISRWTTLTHAEVQPTLGIRQKWKWDIRVLPDSDKLLDPIKAGDILRERCKWFLEK